MGFGKIKSYILYCKKTRVKKKIVKREKLYYICTDKKN